MRPQVQPTSTDEASWALDSKIAKAYRHLGVGPGIEFVGVLLVATGSKDHVRDHVAREMRVSPDFSRTIRTTSVIASSRGKKVWLLALTAAFPVLVMLGLAAPAGAHVTVHPSSLPAGSSDVELTFRVPNERDDASTVKIQVFFPTNLPLLTVDILPIPGWTSAVHTQSLAKPIQTDDGPVSQIVAEVTWTAAGSGIQPGQYEDFVVAAGSMPDKAGTLIFKALQTYSSGEIVRWIEVPIAGQPEPDTPAPILTLTPQSAPTAAPSGASEGTSTRSSSTTTADALAAVALLVSLTCLGIVLFRIRR
jgi:uncharacterized protein YcnI